MNNYLHLYVGTADTPDDTIEDALYLDIDVAGKEIPVDKSAYISGLSGEGFLTNLERLLNLAKLLKKELHLEIRMDTDEIIEAGEEECFDERTMRNIKLLLKEVLDS